MTQPQTGIPVDDQFLLDYVAKGGKAQTMGGSEVDSQNIDSYLDTVAGDKTAPSTTPKQDALHKEAVRKNMGDTSKEDAKRQQREKERQEKLRQQEQAKQQSAATSAAHKGIQIGQQALAPVVETGAQMADRVAALRTVGGIGLLLLILTILLFAVVRVNAAGDTRLKQLWYMLMGRASLAGRVKVQTQDNNNSNTATEQDAAHQAGQALLGALEGGVLQNAGNIIQDVGKAAGGIAGGNPLPGFPTLPGGWQFMDSYRNF